MTSLRRQFKQEKAATAKLTQLSLEANKNYFRYQIKPLVGEIVKTVCGLLKEEEENQVEERSRLLVRELQDLDSLEKEQNLKETNRNEKEGTGHTVNTNSNSRNMIMSSPRACPRSPPGPSAAKCSTQDPKYHFFNTSSIPHHLKFKDRHLDGHIDSPTINTNSPPRSKSPVVLSPRGNNTRSPRGTNNALSPRGTNNALSPRGTNNALSPRGTNNALSPRGTNNALSTSSTRNITSSTRNIDPHPYDPFTAPWDHPVPRLESGERSLQLLKWNQKKWMTRYLEQMRRDRAEEMRRDRAEEMRRDRAEEMRRDRAEDGVAHGVGHGIEHGAEHGEITKSKNIDETLRKCRSPGSSAERKKSPSGSRRSPSGSRRSPSGRKISPSGRKSPLHSLFTEISDFGYGDAGDAANNAHFQREMVGMVTEIRSLMQRKWELEKVVDREVARGAMERKWVLEREVEREVARGAE